MVPDHLSVEVRLIVAERERLAEILGDCGQLAIVKTMIAMADELGLDVIAEGVETEAQREFLGRHGCHAFQGYLFGRPVPIDRFEDSLRGGK